MKTKICTKCKVEKSFDEFNNRKASKDGKTPTCKLCITKYHKQYCIDNKDAIATKKKIYANNNKEVISKRASKYYYNNIEHVNMLHAEWCENNKDKIKIHNHTASAKRKSWLPPLLINDWFENSELHHLHLIDTETGEIDRRVSIFIPREIHRAVWHSNKIQSTMDEINKLAMEWYNGYKL